MTRSNFLVAAAVILGLSACATPQNYEAKMKSFVGLDRVRLVEQMKANRFGDSIAMNRMGEDITIGFLKNRWISIDKGFDLRDMNCHTIFTLRDGKAVSYEYFGDKCVAF